MRGRWCGPAMVATVWSVRVSRWLANWLLFQCQWCLVLPMQTTMIPIPRFCVLCGSHVVGMWRIPRNTVWNVARVLLLCSKCAAREGAYCTHVDGLDDCEPSYPFLAAADLPIAVSLGICW